MLIGFIGLAVPITIASIQTSAQLSRNSRVYDTLLTGMYNSGSAIEVALHQILSDPNFDDGLTPGSPSKAMTADTNGETVDITVTKLFTSSSVEGQGLVVTKTVMPTSTPVDTATTFTYTITIRNEGTGTQGLLEIKDFMPPGFTYVTSSTSGITTSDPVTNPGGADTGERFLNDGGGPALPWSADQGTDQVVASSTPAQNVWYEVPEYWETPAYGAGGTLRATSWQHTQWLKTPLAGNKWRWKVQLVRGGVSDLFTSVDKVVGKNNQWTDEDISYDPGDISILAGDKLRIRLEIWSGSGTAVNRKMEYRWGGYDNGPDYDSLTDIPHLSYCTVTPQYEFKWILSPAVQIGSQEEKTLTFQATATLPDGTYYNQVEAKYDPWWTPINIDTKTRSSQTAPVTVGSGATICINGAELRVTQTVIPQEVAPGVETVFTHTITMENISPVTLWTCRVKDWLPPTFTYVTGFTAGAIDREPKDVKWKADEGRYEAKWDRDQYPENNDDFMFSIDSGVTKSFSFKTLGTVEQGMIYYNEIKEVKYNDVANCDEAPKALGGTNFSGGATFATGIYDVQAVAADGTVKARAVLSSLNGTVEILSWQEN